jgi:hypothetical protein
MPCSVGGVLGASALSGIVVTGGNRRASLDDSLCIWDKC